MRGGVPYSLPLAKGEVRRGSKRLRSRRRSSQALTPLFTPSKSPPSEGGDFEQGARGAGLAGRTDPRILEPSAYGQWLGTNLTDTEDLTQLLAPFPPEDMEATPADMTVNNPGNEGAACVERVNE